jgi:choline dehydrogenase-like flavoprotein
MIRDGRTIPKGESIQTDVCIIGAGPAGISVAKELADSGARVCLVESGGFEFDPVVDSLNQAAISSSHHVPEAAIKGRRRQFGGTPNLWTYKAEPDDGRRRARMLIPQQVDLENSGDRPHGGWPIDRAALEPFYRRANTLCMLGPVTYDAGSWERDDARALQLDGTRLANIVCHHAARDVFTDRYRDDVRLSDTISLLHHANVVEIQTEETNGRVERVRAACLDGTSFDITAQYFVLAAGGIENPRLLLASTSRNGRGLGNDNDLVGRCLMDHPELRLGVIVPNRESTFESMAFYDLRWVDGLIVSGQLALQEEVIRREKLLNICFMLVGRPKGAGSAVEKSLKMIRSAPRGVPQKEVLRHVGKAVGHLGTSVVVVKNKLRHNYTESYGGWSRAAAAGERFGVLEVIAAAEQLPNRDNRITLADERDQLGMRKAQIRWRLNQPEVDTIERAEEILSEDVARIGLGRFEPWVGITGAARPSWPGLHHPMGTTRMSTDPRHGVVDDNCKVHGIPNLFIAGSSVFPTSVGFSNPTLSIIALSIRLADHLRKLLS